MNEDDDPRTHPFAHSGLAAVSDLQHPAWRELFGSLLAVESRFLQHESQFRSPEYKWPRNVLETWSRCWEYPYAYFQLRVFRHQPSPRQLPQVVDLGSGVTFFPFAMASLGYDVLCVDSDPICERDLARATTVVKHEPGRVQATTAEGRCLPLDTGQADVVVCISVLEHIDEFISTVREASRVLRPGGLFVLTVDLDLRGDHGMAVEPYRQLVRDINRDFEYVWPMTCTHPRDILRSYQGPYPIRGPMGAKRLLFLAKNALKWCIRRRPAHLVPFDLAVAGFTLVRRQAP
jgi:SAM-dependent methyltransferase